ncbi:DinB family protein [Fulvivirga ulvae]|uniref:DinB family protein n=1 Tax=Fulvivirga ulvae TaxID=2904245 RepID=UPI001F2DC94A|nr:DinB family protein [Fulvivirga ulvae]UII32925.1 DinB family protein [Fulvivirga ulvae]
MQETEPYFERQYQLIRESRRVLFDYCKTISNEDFVNQNSSFGRGGSIRNLLVHIGNTYEYWIIKHALNKEVSFTQYKAKKTIDEVVELFRSIDREVFDFINRYESSKFALFDLKLDGITKRITVFELFTHVITHEFHHKGQILSLSRHLGYTPIDTDIIR